MKRYQSFVQVRYLCKRSKMIENLCNESRNHYSLISVCYTVHDLQCIKIEKKALNTNVVFAFYLMFVNIKLSFLPLSTDQLKVN